MLENIYVDSNVFPFGGYERIWEKARIVILGVPYDSTSSYRPGSRFGPNVIRLAAANVESYSLRAGLDVDEIDGIYDWGDLVVTHDVKTTLKRVTDAVADIISVKKFPLILGGEHTITYGVINGLEEHVSNAFTLVVFDAHLDLRNEYPPGDPLTHATVLRRIHESFRSKIDKIIILGMRAVSKEEINYLQQNKGELLAITSLDIMQEKEEPLSVLDTLRGKDMYLSIDVDVVDPAFAPGVSNPEIEGIDPSHLLDLLKLVFEKCRRIIGADIVEYNPVYDKSGVTAVLVAKLIYEIVAMTHVWRKI